MPRLTSTSSTKTRQLSAFYYIIATKKEKRTKEHNIYLRYCN